MDEWLQWAITTIVGILGILAGRMWARYDRQLLKDKDLIEKIQKVVPVDGNALSFLRQHDFGGQFKYEPLRSFRELELLLNQPGSYFLNKKLELIKQELSREITEFLEFVAAKTFVSDVSQDISELPGPDDVLSRILRRRSVTEEMTDTEIDEIEKNIHADFQRNREKLNQMSTSICAKYDRLISTAHKIL